jgi:hypothetical protein
MKPQITRISLKDSFNYRQGWGAAAAAAAAADAVATTLHTMIGRLYLSA